MKTFLSHSSRDKALVREIRSHLPKHIDPWLDEEKLLIGSDLRLSIQQAIQEDADFVVIFLGREAIQSEWVQRELRWALEREKRIGRVFVLPVLLDDVWNEVQPPEFQSRLYLKCFDQSASAVKAVADKLSEHVFAWLSAHLDESKKKDLERQREAEISGQALKVMGEMTKAFATEVPDSWSKELRELAISLQGIDPKLQLSRLLKKVERELEKWREAEHRTRESLEKREVDNPLSVLGLTMTAISNSKMVEMLENCLDELAMWRDQPDQVDQGRILDRVHKLLGVPRT